MKKFFFLLILILCSAVCLQGQPLLYGKLSNFIFRYDAGTDAYYKVKDFVNAVAEGKGLVGSLLFASNGLLYGMTERGGASDIGVLFSLDPSTNSLTKLKDFSSTDGYPQNSTLIQASNGLIYGTTSSAIFSYNPNSNTYTEISNLYYSRPSTLVQASDGLLYGTRMGEGLDFSVAYLFSVDPQTNTYTDRQKISYLSFGSMVEAGNGLLYGLNINGVIFSFNRNTNTYKEIIVNDQTNAFGGLIKGSNGLIYGQTVGLRRRAMAIPGQLFSFNPNTNTLINIHPIGHPETTPMQASDGLIYGLADGGIFSYNPVTRVYKILRSAGPSGGSRNSGLTEVWVTPACSPPNFLNSKPIVGNATCGNNDGQISIIPQSGTAPYMYSVDGGVTYVSGPNAGYTFNNLAPGAYNLRIKDSKDCVSDVVEVVVLEEGCPCKLNATGIVNDASCNNNDGQISFILTSGVRPFNISIDGGATYSPDAYFSDYTLQGLAPGTYLLRIKDAGGCETAVINRTITTRYNIPMLTPNGVTKTDATCGLSDAQITITPNGGGGPMLYSIDGGNTYTPGANSSHTFNNLPAGNYQVRIKNDAGCETEIMNINIIARNCPPDCTKPTFLNTLAIVGDASCNANDGVISIIPTSGSGPFRYSIDGGATYTEGPDAGYTFLNLAPGNYQLRLMDASGCESETIVKTIVELYGKPIYNRFSAFSVTNANCGQTDGSITVFADHYNQANFGLPLLFSIDGGATNVQHNTTAYTFNNLPAGNYQVRLKSMMGCESEILEAKVQNINCPSLTQTSNELNKGKVTGENSKEEELKVFAYPNPSRGQFKLHVLQSTTGKAEVFIYDGKGTLVQQSIINSAKGNTVDVNLSSKARGMYHVKVISQQGISTSKIMIQ